MWMYGMRMRPFGIGCQPKDGLVKFYATEGKYHSVLVYNRRLTKEEIYQYELDCLGTFIEYTGEDE